MDSLEEVEDFVRNGHQQYLPHISLDSVIFGYHDQQLKILLLKYKGLNGWGLPGGFIQRREPLGQAAQRILKERTGLDNVFLQQFHVFGDSPYRLQEQNIGELSERYGHTVVDSWLFERTLAIGYFALVDYLKVSVQNDFLTEDFQWWDVLEVPPLLLFDHHEVVEKALATLRLQIYHQPIGYNLLPNKFTLPEIHALYETILGKQLDIRNFAKKLLSLGILEKLDERRAIGPHRSPNLYKFEEEAYQAALSQGLVHTY